jgi:hypothetical protein
MDLGTSHDKVVLVVAVLFWPFLHVAFDVLPEVSTAFVFFTRLTFGVQEVAVKAPVADSLTRPNLEIRWSLWPVFMVNVIFLAIFRAAHVIVPAGHCLDLLLKTFWQVEWYRQDLLAREEWFCRSRLNCRRVSAY